MDTIMNTIEVIKEKLNLVPHPEGGFYRESYRSRDYIHQDSLPPEYKDQRHYSTCIYYLLTLGNFSAFHRIRQDEIWHFYDGTAIQLHTISPEGQYQKHSIGRNIIYGEFPQLIVPGGHWFAAEVTVPNSYALVGCTVSPGFHFDDFELGNRNELIDRFPKHREVIIRLSRS
ncbi:MAG TPA: cupin domain-containing protein [Membranihabitans sp.]|nr:cupin domain-containing protein [Membranihabitans sp.]